MKTLNAIHLMFVMGAFIAGITVVPISNPISGVMIIALIATGARLLFTMLNEFEV